jgi:hypothetical protein
VSTQNYGSIPTTCSPYAGRRLAEQLGFTPVSRPRLAERPSTGGGEDDDRSRWLRVMDLARKPSNHP